MVSVHPFPDHRPCGETMSEPPVLHSLKDIASSPDIASPNGPLAQTLSVLFEPSAILSHDVVPKVAEAPPASSYAALIDLAITSTLSLPNSLQASMISGHPRIGEAKNLSHLSAKEQAATTTPPEVLARLAHLNACYERRYPGLIYITFVNGRSRATIAEEMEDVLGLEHSLQADYPLVDEFEVIPRESEPWKKELERAVMDVGRIAKSRLKTLGVA